MEMDESEKYDEIISNNISLNLADIQRKIIIMRLERTYETYEELVCANPNSSIKIKTENRLNAHLQVLLIILKPRLLRVGKYDSFEKEFNKKNYVVLLTLIAEYLDSDLKLTNIEQDTELSFDEASR